MHHSVDQDMALLYEKVHLENKNNQNVVWWNKEVTFKEPFLLALVNYSLPCSNKQVRLGSIGDSDTESLCFLYSEQLLLCSVEIWELKEGSGFIILFKWEESPFCVIMHKDYKGGAAPQLKKQVSPRNPDSTGTSRGLISSLFR